jgi:hypothetical protein
VFTRAAREIRVVGGLLLIVAGVAMGAWVANDVTRQADRDYAVCGKVVPAPPDCDAKRRPISVGWVQSSSNGFRREYELSVHTRRNFTFTVGGLSAADVAPFQGLQTAEARYRQGRLVAILAPDGTSLEVPFAFSKRLVVYGSTALVLALLGIGSLAWGFTRVNRNSRA